MVVCFSGQKRRTTIIIYYWGSPEKPPVAEYTLICCPIGHLPKERENFPSDWMDHTGDKPKPVEFKVQFFHGEAEVDDALGRYLISAGLAQKSRLVLPNSWSR